MRILVACEMSGIVRDAFAALGHDAWSCDLMPSERPGKHIQGSVMQHDITRMGWDLMIAHPDCTFLTVSSNRWASEEWRIEARLSAMHFVRSLWAFPIPRIAIENPVGVLSTFWRKPDQTIQPWEHGDGFVKGTCLWLRGLPPLTPTNIVEGREAQCWKMGKSPTRKTDRSRTYQGIANAMAQQWGCTPTLAAA